MRLLKAVGSMEDIAEQQMVLCRFAEVLVTQLVRVS